jgi:hypothetical protein
VSWFWSYDTPIWGMWCLYLMFLVTHLRMRESRLECRANAHNVARAWSIFEYPARPRELSSPVFLKFENSRQDAYRKYPLNAFSIASILTMGHPAST